MKTTKITMTLLSTALLAAACSTDDSVSPSSSSSNDISSNTVTLKNEVDESRLTSMNINDDIWTRSSSEAYEGDITILDCPTLPTENIVDLSQQDPWSYSAKEGEVLYIPANYTHDLPIGFYYNGSDLYVAGDLTYNSTSWGKGNIYILDGGSVTFPANFALSDIQVYSWGKINFEGNCTINSSSSLYNYSDYTLELTSSDGNEFNLQINSNFESVGCIVADKVEIIGANQWESSRIVKFGDCVNVGTLDLSNYGELYISSYGLVADVVDLHSYSNLYLTGGTLVLVSGSINFENYSCFVNLSTEYAVIDTELVTIDNNTFLNRINGGPVDLNYRSCEDDNSGNDIQWTSNVVFNQETYVADNDCHDGYGASTDEPKEPVLEHDAVVTSPNIERISATSIDFNDGRVFVSWHEAGSNYQGYIDVVDMESMSIEATLYTTELDFNHMYINNGVAYVTGGDNKQGAFYSEVAYSSGSDSVSVEVIYVEGSSGNCITIENDEKWVVSGSNGGLTIVETEEVNGETKDVQNYTDLAEAKFVEPYNGVMAVLAGLESTYIYEYDLNGTLTDSYDVGSIDPSDGKNTLHADGDAIYACLSTSGLVKAVGGVVDSSLSLSEDQIGSVNCIDTDDNYIYIANGTHGLTIVDKSTWATVKEYTLGGASANYIKLGEDGYIYVAYGLNGVHRFRLVE
ncbi:MAG: hypothetical protein SNI45_02345 [Rikenellaceae bacterium]